MSVFPPEPEARQRVRRDPRGSHTDYPTPGVKMLLDHRMYPHIMDLIVDFAPQASLISLRAVSHHFRRRCEQRLCRHLVVHATKLPIGYDGDYCVDNDVPVLIDGPDGRLPMFMDWSNELQEHIPRTIERLRRQYPDLHAVGTEVWIPEPTPKVLYPSMLTELYGRNLFIRAARTVTLLQHCEVLDVIGTLPLPRFREVLSALTNCHVVIRLRPDSQGHSTWFNDPTAFPDFHFDDLIEGRRDPDEFVDLAFGRLDTLVHFQEMNFPENTGTIIQARAVDIELIHHRAKKIVIHFTMREDDNFTEGWQDQDFDMMWRHRFGYTLAEDTIQVVIIFHRAPVTPGAKLHQPPSLLKWKPLSRFLTDVAKFLTTKVRVTFVNTTDVLPGLIGLPWETPAHEMPDHFAKYFIKRSPQGIRNKDHVDELWRVVTLDEYREEVGEWRFEMETVASKTHSVPERDGIDMLELPGSSDSDFLHTSEEDWSDDSWDESYSELDGL